MLKFRKFSQGMLLKSFAKIMQMRKMSVLYVTGDKACENYVALQPFMDFENILHQKERLQQSISGRKCNINLNEVLDMYENYKNEKEHITQLDKKRESVTKKLKAELKINTPNEEKCYMLKEQGRTLRSDLKLAKENFYPVADKFIQSYLALPNFLHKFCPINCEEKIVFCNSVARLEEGMPHLQHKDKIRFLDNSIYYLMDDAAELDYDATRALTRYFVNTGEFLLFSNPDFVREILLEANTTPKSQYHMVIEENVKNKFNGAFLTGGGTFESFLGAVAKLSVFPTILPLHLVACGRSYLRTGIENNLQNNSNKQPNLYTATQSNAVQTFVITNSAQEADDQLERILNNAVDFYKQFNIHFRIVYADAAKLTPAECLRAVIEIYSPVQKEYICVGHVSNYADYVSKRILFNVRYGQNYSFPHLIGGPVMYTTRVIAALLEHGIDLKQVKMPVAFPEDLTYLCDFDNDYVGIQIKDMIEKTTEELEKENNKNRSATDEFKDLFK